MPGVEVAVAKVRQEAAEADEAAGDERPPGPGLAFIQREGREPEIENADGGDGAAERDAVVDHEMHDPAFVDAAESIGRHAEVGDVVRQEVLCGRQEEGEEAGEEQREACDGDERTAVADEGWEETLFVKIHQRSAPHVSTVKITARPASAALSKNPRMASKFSHVYSKSSSDNGHSTLRRK